MALDPLPPARAHAEVMNGIVRAVVHEVPEAEADEQRPLRVPMRAPDSTMSKACCCEAAPTRLRMSREMETSRVDSRYSSSGNIF